MADNFHVTIKAEIGLLPDALELALSGSAPVWGYAIVQSEAEEARGLWRDMGKNGPRFVLFRWKGEKATPFPTPLSPRMCADIIAQWLATAQYGGRPDHDGDNGKGFFLTTGAYWNHVDGMGHGACAEVRPCWMMYGK